MHTRLHRNLVCAADRYLIKVTLAATFKACDTKHTRPSQKENGYV